MTGGEDISWSVLGRIVRQWAGSPAELAEVIPLSGGSVNNTLLLVTRDDRKVVLKITPHRVNRELETEAVQLHFLREIGIPAPRVYHHQIASLEDPNSFLLMEHVEGITLSEAKKTLPPEQYEQLQHQLADLVLKLHHRTRGSYGRVGSRGHHTTGDWPAFYRSLYEHAVRVVEQVKEIPLKMRKKIEKLNSRLDRHLSHEDRPRLCHGDLWGANVICRPDDTGDWRIAAIIDPNLRFAHAESELAYLDLFDTCTKTFRRAYQANRRLDDDYHRVRKPIYQLYPMINHVQFFGTRYIPPLMRVAERATAVV